MTVKMKASDLKLTEVRLARVSSNSRRRSFTHLVRLSDGQSIWTIGPEVMLDILELESKSISFPILAQMLNLKICAFVPERLDLNLLRFKVDEEFCLVESKSPLSPWVNFKFIPPSPEAFLLAESICKSYAERRKWGKQLESGLSVGGRNYAAAQALEVQTSFIGLEKAFKRIGGIL